MGASSTTPNIDLPQFADADKPTWRGDINDAMSKIDTAIVSKADLSLLPSDVGSLIVGAGGHSALLPVGAIGSNLNVNSSGTPQWGTPVVEPEQFAGATDDAKFSAALAAIAVTGGKIRLRPGKTYTWIAAPTTFDFTVNHKPIIIEAWGAIINANYAGDAWITQGNTGNTVANGLIWLGGEINNSVGNGIALNDSGKAFFFRTSAGCPNGSGWTVNNITSFSENHHFIECYDNNSKHSISFQNLGSPSASMARLVIRSMRIQGGVAGEAKLNFGDNVAPYGGLIDGLSGNLVDQAIVMRIAGNWHGLIIQGNLHFEVSTTGTAYYFTVGTLTGGQRGSLIAPLNVNATMGLVAPASLQTSLYGVLYLSPGVLGVGAVSAQQRLNSAGALDLPATTPTDVFTVTFPNVGEYRLDVRLCVRTIDASTANTVQARLLAGTAVYTVSGQTALEIGVPVDVSPDKQVCAPSISAYLTVTTPGTLTVSVRTAVHSEMLATTPLSNYGGASGLILQQTA